MGRLFRHVRYFYRAHYTGEGGDHILANTNIYGETYQMLKTLLPQYGVETTFVDLNDKEAVSRAIRPNTRLFMVKSSQTP